MSDQRGVGRSDKPSPAVPEPRPAIPEPRPAIPARLQEASAQEVLQWALARFGRRLTMACSFQKEESVLVHMLCQLTDSPRLFTIDTGVLFAETHATWRRFEQHFGVRVESFDARRRDGDVWTAECCCGEAKVAALQRALAGERAWVTGIRREQAPTRAAVEKVAFDARRGIFKVNPLADWSESDVWRYIAAHDLPYHPLHDRGYGSIGCQPCTVPGRGREGRWAGQEKTECGLYL
jgi:phosphoadenosine phosphosulfate reductase